ncbi:MAG: helix-turn-helix domain-containing protein [Spirochaetales bacterium]|jgi:transcriptional regulator with XRE-family HTH domain|nr:helix-turn-helix domain-containing protein [Spirochaetales bacterium]
MASFAERLRDEIEYSGMSQKEFAAKANIKKRALDMYLGSQKSMPPADTAVKIASVLGVSVEYLVTGKEIHPAVSLIKNTQLLVLYNDLKILPREVSDTLKKLVRSLSQYEYGRKTLPPQNENREARE